MLSVFSDDEYTFKNHKLWTVFENYALCRNVLGREKEFNFNNKKAMMISYIEYCMSLSN